MITQKQCLELFEYKDGQHYWKIKPLKGKVKIGDCAGSSDGLGYFQTKINGKAYKNHRIIFLMHHGYLPNKVDHKKGLSNTIDNLRDASDIENAQNSKIPSNNTSGYKNVRWNKRNKKWVVEIRVNYQRKYFGSYFDIEVAKFVAETMRHKYHAKFANHQ